jgi:hypothetical protein
MTDAERAGIWVFPQSKHQQDFSRAVFGLSGQSDRAAVLVTTVILDLILTDALKIHLHKMDDVADKLFGISGAIGDLSPKIDLALLVGLIDVETHRDLVTIKDIRNRFAHRISVWDFKSDSIASLSINLKICVKRTCSAPGPPADWPEGCWFNLLNRDAILANPRERFILSIQVLCYGLGLTHQTAMPMPLF